MELPLKLLNRILLVSLCFFATPAESAVEPQQEPEYLWQKDLTLKKNPAGQLQYFNQEQKPLDGYFQIQLDNGYIQATFSRGFFNGQFKQVDNNRLKYLIDYCDSKPCGSYKSYFSDGKIAKHKNYNKWSQLEGLVRTYSPEDGRLLRKTSYLKGVKNGVEVVYFPSGLESVQTRTNYELGVKHGEQTQYFQEGGLEVRQNFLNDKLHGIHVKLNPSGEKIFEVNYADGNYHGTANMFMDGKLWIKKHYQQGQLHGKWIEYDLEQKGITKQVKYFENDQEIEQ